MTPEEILVVALYDIACNRQVNTYEDMIDTAVNGLSAYMKAKKIDILEVPGRPKEPVKLD
jgi:hypothetical protein